MLAPGRQEQQPLHVEDWPVCAHCVHCIDNVMLPSYKHARKRIHICTHPALTPALAAHGGAGFFGASAGTWAKYAKIMFLLGIVGDIVRSSAPSLRLFLASVYASLSCPLCVAVCDCDCVRVRVRVLSSWAVMLRGATPRRRQEAERGAACG